MPKFTVILQTSPADEPGKVVNSLPPVKSPREPLASGDTVPEKWTMEVATLEEVTALIRKEMESLTARVAALEAKPDGQESKDAKEEKHGQEAKASSDIVHSDGGNGDRKDRSAEEAGKAGAEGAGQGKNAEREKRSRQKREPQNP
jgi:hypothetical protein